MATGTKVVSKTKEIVPCSAYSVISVHEIQHYEGYESRLIKVRNPHGKKVWDGNWGPWLKSQVGFTDDKKEFLISFDDYLKQFNDTSICFLGPTDYSNSLIVDFYDPRVREVKPSDSNYGEIASEPTMAFFEIYMDETEVFFAQCFQSGNHLRTYRHEQKAEKFEPSCFNLTLIDLE